MHQPADQTWYISVPSPTLMCEPKPCQGAHGLGMLLAPTRQVQLHSDEPWHCAHGCSLLVHRALRPCVVSRCHGESTACLVPHQAMALRSWSSQLALLHKA